MVDESPVVVNPTVTEGNILYTCILFLYTH